MDRILAVFRREVADKDRFLDVGCGTGDYLTEARHLGATRCVGTDISSSYCRRTLRDRVGALVTQADGVALPFPDGAFDAVLCREVIEHLPRDAYRCALDELFRVSRRTVIITTPNRRAAIRRIGARLLPRQTARLDESVGHINLLTADQIRLDAARAGWTVDAVTTAHVLPPVIGEMLRFPRSFDRVARVVEWAGDRLAQNSGNISILIAHKVP
jgi:SAM-dependent methyltransferase